MDFPRDRIGTAVFRLLLLGAPSGFRSRFGADMVDALRLRADDTRRAGGTGAVTRYWIRQWGNLMATLFAEWVDVFRPVLTSPNRLPGKLPARERLFMDRLLTDLRYSFRTLMKQPGFTLVVVATLALGIGANTAIFSILDAVVLRPLPYERPEELLLITDEHRAYNIAGTPMAPYEVRALRERTQMFDTVGVSAGPFQAPLTSDDGEPEQIQMMNLSPGYLDMLGVPPLVGRVFTQEEGTPVPPEIFTDPTLEVPPSVVLLDFDFWNRRFGGDPQVVGSDLTINARRFRVVGIMPEGFRVFVTGMAGGSRGSQASDVYGPVQADFDLPTGAGFLTVVGRMSEGVTAAQANEELTAVSADLRENHERSNRGQIYTSAVPWGSEISRSARPALLALLGAVVFVLLIACANVANLLLARATSRRQEIAVRVALGARRGHIIRQVLTEGMLLAGAGGALGLLVAGWGVQVLLSLQPGGMPRSDTVGISGEVVLFTIAATVFAVVLFAVAPALALAGVRGNLALNERGTGGGTLGRSRLRSLLVVAEVAMSLVLLVGAGLMLRSFGHLSAIDPGFRPESVLTFQMQLAGAQYRDPETRQAFLREAVRSIEESPGVEATGAATVLPLTGGLFAGSFHTETMSPEAPGIEANYRGVTAGFLRAMGTPVLQGRDFDPVEANTNVVLVDKQLAEHTFPGENPLGRRITIAMPSFPAGPATRLEVEIVGVVADVRDDGGLEAPGRRTIYLPHQVIPFGGAAFAVRTSINPEEVLPQIRERIAGLDSEVPIFSVRPMQGYIDDALAPVRFTLILIGIFGVFALVLAAIGLYGVLSNAVRQQTRDLGVRLAFGATSGQILKQVVGRGTALAAAGIVIGLVIAIPLTRATQSLFVGVAPTDPLTLVGISLLLLGVSVVACYLPARRASRLDPANSLRAD